MLTDLPCILIRLFTFFFLLRLVLSFFPIKEESLAGSARGFSYLITEPVVAPIRRVAPPLPFAGFGVAELLLLIGLQVLQLIVC